MGQSIPPLTPFLRLETICGYCSRDNYGSTDSTCRGCGAPVDVFSGLSSYSSAEIDAAIFSAGIGMFKSEPPSPPSVGYVWA